MHFRLLLVAAIAGAFLTATAVAEGAYRFGSELDPTVQPSNAETAHPCNNAHPGRRCTWIMNEAYGRPNGGHKARRAGTITRLRLIAGEEGRFRLQIARAHETSSGFVGKVLRNGPVIVYDGQPDPNEPYVVEVFRVNVPIRKGERLAINARRTSTLRCSSGGPNTLLFHPPLVPGAGFRANSDDDGCWLLLEAVVRPANP